MEVCVCTSCPIFKFALQPQPRDAAGGRIHPGGPPEAGQWASLYYNSAKCRRRARCNLPGLAEFRPSWRTGGRANDGSTRTDEGYPAVVAAPSRSAASQRKTRRKSRAGAILATFRLAIPHRNPWSVSVRRLSMDCAHAGKHADTTAQAWCRCVVRTKNRILRAKQPPPHLPKWNECHQSGWHTGVRRVA